MPGQLQTEFCVTELDVGALSTTFQVETHWHVLTGAPCCGKTTMIEMLAERGYPTLPEIGRLYIEREIAKGRDLAEFFVNVEDERAMQEWQFKNEHTLQLHETSFLDRALPDVLTFHRLKEIDPNEILGEFFHFHYASVFVLDRLPLEVDWARLDDDSLNKFLDEWLARDYAALGYDVIRVPVLPPKERLDLILDTLTERELIYG